MLKLRRASRTARTLQTVVAPGPLKSDVQPHWLRAISTANVRAKCWPEASQRSHSRELKHLGMAPGDVLLHALEPSQRSSKDTALEVSCKGIYGQIMANYIYNYIHTAIHGLKIGYTSNVNHLLSVIHIGVGHNLSCGDTPGFLCFLPLSHSELVASLQS